MKVTILITCFLFSLNSFSQQQKIDSILHLLQKHHKKDTVMLSQLKWLSFYHQDVDMDKGIRISDSAIAIANQIGEQGRYLAGLYNSKAVNYWAKGENRAAISTYQKAYEIFRKVNDQEGSANMRINIANVLINLNKFDSAIAYLDDAVRVYHRLGNKEKEATIYNNLGVIYQYLLNLPKASECYYKVQLYAEETGDKQMLAAAYTNLGIVSITLSKFEKALEYYNNALSIYQQSNGKQSIADMLVNIARVHYELKNFEKSLSYNQQALKICATTGNKSTIAACYSNMGQLYADLGNYDTAIDFINIGINLSKEMGKEDIVGYNLLSKAVFKANDSTLKKHGILANDRYNKAIYYAKMSLNLANENQTTDNAYYAWQNLSEIYEAQKRYDKALYAYKQFSLLKDSVFKVERMQAITRHEMQFKFEKEKLLISASNERSRQIIERRELKVKLIIVSASIIFIISLIFYVFYKRKKDKAEVAEAEMSMLRAQMKPHFIFNALNSINSYGIEKGASTEMRNYISKFAKLMRLVLDASAQKHISLSKDIEILQLYLQLEMKRTNNKFEYTIVLEPGINKEATVVTPMLLQPFAENCIWHGFATVVIGAKIEVNVTKNNGVLTYLIKDNGIGRKKASNMGTSISNGIAHDSQGIKITKRRIDLLNLENSVKSSMKIFDLQQGTCVEIRLPFKEILPI